MNVPKTSEPAEEQRIIVREQRELHLEWWGKVMEGRRRCQGWNRRQAQEGAMVDSPPHRKWIPRNTLERHHTSKDKCNSRSPVLTFIGHARQQPGRSPSSIHVGCCQPRPVTVVYVKPSSSHRQQHCISSLTSVSRCTASRRTVAGYTNVALPFRIRSQRWSARRTRRHRRTSSEHCRAGGG